MASGLVWYDGFEDTTTPSDYYQISGGVAIGATAARSGSRAMGVFADDRAVRILGVSTTKVIVGGAVYISAYPTSGNKILFAIVETATLHVDVRVNSVGQLFLTRNGTQIGATGSTLSLNTHYYLELKAEIHDTTGTADLYINEVSNISFSGDTRNGGTGLADRVYFGQNTTASGSVYFDDIYIVDWSVSGAALLGDIRVDSYFPDGAGDNADFTPSASTNETNVDETAPDGDTTYNESSTVGHKDTFSMQNTPGAGATVHGVAHIYRHRKTDAGARTVRGLLKSSGGTIQNQTTRSPGTSYASDFEHNETEPGGAAWTETKVNGLKAGYEIVS